MDDADVRKVVRDSYAAVVQQGNSCCGSISSCCGSANTAESISKKIGYSDEDLKAVPEGSNLGLGCGNPIAMASLKEGETVLDLGSGAGFDCFLAAQKVGKTGKVIGVDMTPEMIYQAKENKQKGDYDNVEFRLGEIENLPVAGNSVDVVISNCVINLSPEKHRVFNEAYRALKPGGRLMVSDIVLLKPLPSSILNSIEAYVSCIAGAVMKSDYIDTMRAAGFQDIDVVNEAPFSFDLIVSDPNAQKIISDLDISSEMVKETVNSVISIKVSAIKPNK